LELADSMMCTALGGGAIGAFVDTAGGSLMGCTRIVI